MLFATVAEAREYHRDVVIPAIDAELAKNEHQCFAHSCLADFLADCEIDEVSE